MSEQDEPFEEAPFGEEEEEDEPWRDLGDDPEESFRLFKALEGILPDVLKRGSLGNILSSDEGLRAALLEKNLPREAVGLVMTQADALRKESLRIISREVRVFLENMDFGGEIAKILTSVSFEIKTEIRFIPNDQAVRPQIRNRVKLKGPSGEELEGEEIEELEEMLSEKISSGVVPEPEGEERRSGLRKLGRGLRKRLDDAVDDVRRERPSTGKGIAPPE